jgi:Protein of unknown function DUF262
MSNEEKYELTNKIVEPDGKQVEARKVQVELAEKQIVEQSKRIDFYITEYTIEILAQKMRSGDFEVPDYQREFTWEDERKSRFIESVLMGLPIPFLFFWESAETGKLEIVDGSQRLRTIEEFVLGGLSLGDLEELNLLNGLQFKDLPESRQRKIKNRSIRGIVLNEHTDESSRFDLFERINTGSKVANKAEIRRGALGGPFLDLVISLATDSLFIKLAPVSNKLVLERRREELVTRFFAYGDGLDNYKDRVAAFNFDYTKKKNLEFSDNPEKVSLYRDRFVHTMMFISENFPFGFKKAPKGNATPSARFESIAIGTYLALQESPKLIVDKLEIERWLKSQEFAEVTGADGANVKSKLVNRIDFVRKRLVKV